MHNIDSVSRGNDLAKTGESHYHTQLGLSDKDRAIKGLVACYGSLDKRKVHGRVPCCGRQDGY